MDCGSYEKIWPALRCRPHDTKPRQKEKLTPTFLVRSVLMTDDLPTLGYPTKPTLMYFLSDRRRLSCRSRLNRLPLPAVTPQAR